MDKEVKAAGTKRAEVLWQHNSISMGAEVKNATAYAGVKEDKPFLLACLKRLTKGGKKGHVITSPCPAPPSIHLHAHKNGDRMDPPNFTEAWNNPSFSTLYSWEKLMDLNCITGGPEPGAWGGWREGGRWGSGGGGSKPGESGTEMEFRFNREEDNPSLTVCRFPSRPLWGRQLIHWWFSLSGGATLQMLHQENSSTPTANSIAQPPCWCAIALFKWGKLIMKLRYEWKPKCGSWIIDEFFVSFFNHGCRLKIL